MKIKIKGGLYNDGKNGQNGHLKSQKTLVFHISTGIFQTLLTAQTRSIKTETEKDVKEEEEGKKVLSIIVQRLSVRVELQVQTSAAPR